MRRLSEYLSRQVVTIIREEVVAVPGDFSHAREEAVAKLTGSSENFGLQDEFLSD